MYATKAWRSLGSLATPAKSMRPRSSTCVERTRAHAICAASGLRAAPPSTATLDAQPLATATRISGADHRRPIELTSIHDREESAGERIPESLAGESDGLQDELVPPGVVLAHRDGSVVRHDHEGAISNSLRVERA